MNGRNITYWITTVLACAVMAMSAVMYLTHNPKMTVSFAALGYPSYFPLILGVAKLLGVAALLAPRCGLLKEWAYAGFTFTLIGASVSHFAVGQDKEAIAPLIVLALLTVSYSLRPAYRRAVTTLA